VDVDGDGGLVVFADSGKTHLLLESRFRLFNLLTGVFGNRSVFKRLVINDCEPTDDVVVLESLDELELNEFSLSVLTPRIDMEAKAGIQRVGEVISSLLNLETCSRGISRGSCRDCVLGGGSIKWNGSNRSLAGHSAGSITDIFFLLRKLRSLDDLRSRLDRSLAGHSAGSITDIFVLRKLRSLDDLRSRLDRSLAGHSAGSITDIFILRKLRSLDDLRSRLDRSLAGHSTGRIAGIS
jgi:hypothetical protein